jgi:hypothetical protein
MLIMLYNMAKTMGAAKAVEPAIPAPAAAHA